MGYVSRMKYNMKRKRQERQRIEQLGRVVFNGKLKEMPSDIKQPGRRYRHMRIHNRFGHCHDVVVEIRRRARKA